MNAFWLILAWAWPLAVSLLLMTGGKWIPRCVRHGLTVSSALPALMTVFLLLPGDKAYIQGLLIGMQLEVTVTARLFLLFTSVLWTVASVYAVGYMQHDRHAHSFFIFYHAALAGNIGLILAGDIPSFYAFFALMTFAGYGLVVHNRDEISRRAGRLYLYMAVIGEAMVLTAFFLIVHSGASVNIQEARLGIPGSPYAHVIMVLVLLGFGVKAGLAGLHMWLPLAHPVAPTPASAVLSGAMIKAGLIGWLHFLPGGLASWSSFGHACMALGFIGALGAVAIGCMQREPKTILAYSSVSQMGVMLIAIGIGLSEQEAWAAISVLVCVYAANHAYAKGALFLGVGVAWSASKQPARHPLVLAGLTLAALAISGAPLTGGAIAKSTLKYAAPDYLMAGLIISSIATTLLLSRFVLLMRRDMKHTEHEHHAGLVLPWLGLITILFISPWVVIPGFNLETIKLAPSLTGMWKSAWPVLLGLFVVVIFRRRVAHVERNPLIPAGDICLFFERVAHRLARAWVRYVADPIEKKRLNPTDPFVHLLMPDEHIGTHPHKIEMKLRGMQASGTLFIVLISILIVLMLTGGMP